MHVNPSYNLIDLVTQKYMNMDYKLGYMCLMNSDAKINFEGRGTEGRM